METSEQELSLADLTYIWTPGHASDRSMGRPKEWNGESKGFDDIASTFANCLSGLPGNAERLRSCSQRWNHERRSWQEVWQLLCDLCKSPSCIRHHPEKQNGFDMWGLLYKEYRSDTATRKAGLRSEWWRIAIAGRRFHRLGGWT